MNGKTAATERWNLDIVGQLRQLAIDIADGTYQVTAYSMHIDAERTQPKGLYLSGQTVLKIYFRPTATVPVDEEAQA